MPQARRFFTVMATLFLLLPAPFQSAAKEKSSLILVSYNIHHAEGVDGRLSLDRIADDIRHADVVALQEVDNHFGPRSGFADQAKSLAELLNMYYVFGANLDLNGSTIENGTIRNQRRQYGNAILSRYPIEFSRNYLLPKIQYKNLGSEQRGLLEAQVNVAGKRIRVYSTHLAASSEEQRVLQVKSIKDIVNGAGGIGAPQGNIVLARSSIVMGDFNFSPDSDPYRLLTGEFRRGRQLIKAGGFVDFWPLVNETVGNTIRVRSGNGSRIDYIFLSPDLVECAESAVVNTETIASDHQPLTAVLSCS